MLYDLILTGTLIASTPPESAPCPDYDERRKVALEHAKDGLSGAAREFAALWRDCKRDPRDLYNSASSYFLDHHAALALQLWRELGELPNLDAKLRQAVDDRIADAIAQTIPVKLRFAPPQPDGVVKAYRTRDLTAIHAIVTAAELELRLDRGDWTIVYEARGQRVEQLFKVTGAPGTLVFTAPPPVVAPPQPAPPLQAAKPPPARTPTASSFPTRPVSEQTQPTKPPPPPVVPSAARPDFTSPFLTGVGVGVGIIGLGVTLHQSSHLSAVPEPAKNCVAACNASIARALDQRDAGATLLGSGLGLALTGATARVTNQRQRTGIAIGETALGGVLAAAGVIARIVTLRYERNLVATPLDDPGVARWQRLATWAMADAVILGAGLGLGLGGATKLLVRRARSARERRARLGAVFTRDGLGLQLHGNF